MLETAYQQVNRMSDSETTSEAQASKGGKRISKKSAVIITVVVTAILVAAPLGYLVLTNSNGNEPTEESVLVTVSGKQSSADYKLSDLEAMQYVEQTSSYQNRFGNWKGQGTYRGVELSTLADDVGGMVAGDIMTIEASDGYAQNLSYYQVYPDAAYQATQGQIILAYAFNGTNVSGWTDGPMIAVLAPDQAFSNDDLNQTVDRDPEFAASTSGGSLWVKNVRNITIASMYTEWVVSLTNLENATTNMTRTQFVAIDYWYGTSYVDSKTRNWTGAPVSCVLGLVDDSDPSTFNSTMAESRYRVTVTGADDYNKTVAAEDLVSSGAILAYKLNGTLLSSDTAPLRLTGPGMSGSYQVSKIASITMLQPEDIILTVSGTVTLNYSMTDLLYLPSTTGIGGLRKSTGTIVGPDTYTGVTVSSLLEKVYSGTDFSLEVEATDGYTMTFSSSQALNGTFAYYDSSGNLAGVDNFTMLLAYQMNGQPLGETLRIVIIGPTSPLTDGAFWVKYVGYLTVVPFATEWNLTLDGLTNMTMDRQTFESVATCSHHQHSYTLTNTSGSFVYEGVALWTLVSAVDGADEPDGHYMFNDLLATAGYNVTIVCSNGANLTFNSTQVAHNESLIVANTLDGSPLPDDEFPLRLVGEYLTEEQMVKGIVRIELTNISTDYPMWNLTLVGTKTVTIDSGTFDALYRCGVHSASCTFSSGGSDHVYAGIPLWVLVGAVDGDDGTGHYVFNNTLADQGYSVEVIASDGFNKTFPVSDVRDNDTLIIAYTSDGAYLTGTEYPLRLVGATLGGSMSVKAVVEIQLVGLPT
jgi:DMSO/TMAO reductase YedYZ molybdopterin-dependent catalytic subunit